jgi:cytochrome c-type protein NapC
MNLPKTIRKLAPIMVLAPIVVIVSWGTTEIMVEQTGGKEFCTGCHTMVPMGESYKADTHGGANNVGFRADCIDCHVSHDNPFAYLWGKAVSGTHDVWATLTYDLDAIDWEAKRKHPEEFVFDSGCLHCHIDLESATMSDVKAFVAHKPYFLGKTKQTCANCHSVGHKNLSKYIVRTGSLGESK